MRNTLLVSILFYFYTAFTVPGMGQFEWKVVSMGLASAPSAFQRLVELVVKGIDHVVVYIDDLIIHTKTHEQHLESLDKVFTRLAAHNLRVNLKVCLRLQRNLVPQFSPHKKWHFSWNRQIEGCQRS